MAKLLIISDAKILASQPKIKLELNPKLVLLNRPSRSSTTWATRSGKYFCFFDLISRIFSIGTDERVPEINYTDDEDIFSFRLIMAWKYFWEHCIIICSRYEESCHSCHTSCHPSCHISGNTLSSSAAEERIECNLTSNNDMWPNY